jgi:penicillin-binding protein 1A
MRPLPALALGTEDVSIYDMVGAYAVFANGGIYTEPTIVTRIEDKNGAVLYQHMPVTKDVMSEETAYVTTKLLEGVTRSGSGRRLRFTHEPSRLYKEVVTDYPYGFKNDIAGKTGTTQNQSDGWFMGMVPDLVTGVWVGGEDRSIHFAGIDYGQGATMALPIWASYMKALYADPEVKVSDEPFEEPENLTIEVNCDNYTSDARGSDLQNEEEQEIMKELGI